MWALIPGRAARSMSRGGRLLEQPVQVQTSGHWSLPGCRGQWTTETLLLITVYFYVLDIIIIMLFEGISIIKFKMCWLPNTTSWDFIQVLNHNVFLQVNPEYEEEGLESRSSVSVPYWRSWMTKLIHYCLIACHRNLFMKYCGSRSILVSDWLVFIFNLIGGKNATAWTDRICTVYNKNAFSLCNQIVHMWNSPLNWPQTNLRKKSSSCCLMCFCFVF